MATLVYSDVDGIDRSYTVGNEPAMVGRGPDCAIRSQDSRVSRRHARFFLENDTLWVEDLGSANGIFVGPNKVRRAPVPIGEILLIGSLVLRLMPASGTLPPPTGLHGTLALWLDVERRTRVTVEEERDAFAKRVGDLHEQIALLRAPDSLTTNITALDGPTPEAIRLRDEAEARAAALERALAAVQDELVMLREGGVGGGGELGALRARVRELEKELADRADWSSKLDVESTKLVEEVARLRSSVDEADAARSVAEHAHGEAMRDAQVVRAELDQLRKDSVAELESLRLELVQSRDENTTAETSVGIATAGMLAEADLVISGLQGEIAALKKGAALPEQRARDAVDQVTTLTAKVEALEKELAGAQIRAQGAERNLAGVNARAAQAEARAAQLEQRATDTELRATAAERDVEQARKRTAALDASVAAQASSLKAAEERATHAASELASNVSRLATAEQRATAEATMARTMAKDVAEALRRAADTDNRAKAVHRELAEANRRADQAEAIGRERGTSIDDAVRRATEAEARAVARQGELAAELDATRHELATKLDAAYRELAAERSSSISIIDRKTSIERELADARRDLPEQQQRARDAEDKLIESEQQLEALRARVNDLETSAALSSGELQALLDDALARATEAERIAGALSASSEAADQAIGRAGALERQLDEAVAKLAWHERETASRGHDRTAAAKAEEVLTERVAAAEARAIEAEGRARNADDRIEDSENRAREAESRFASAARDLAEVSTRVAESERSLAEATSNLAVMTPRLAALQTEVDNAENVRSFAAETEREIAQLQRDLREARSKLTQMTLERDRIASELKHARDEEDTLNRLEPIEQSAVMRSDDPEVTVQADLKGYAKTIEQSTDLQAELIRLEREDARLRKQLAAVEQKLREAVADHGDHESTRTATGLPSLVSDHVNALEEAIDSLRANMRAASDETATMAQSESVITIASAVGQAQEHVERARAAIKLLATAIGMDPE